MLSQLKKWFRSNASRPAASRIAKVAGLRGQVEHLEARTVLSATVGTFSGAFEMGRADVREDSLSIVSRRLDYTNKPIAGAHWEDAPMTGMASNGRLAQLDASGAKLPIAASWYPPLFDRSRVTVFVVSAFTPSGGYTADSGHTTVPKSIAANSPYPSWQNEPPQAPQRHFDYLGSHAGLLASLSDMTDSEPSTSASVRNRNSVSLIESDASLLLATRIGDLNASDNDRIADELWAKPDHVEGVFEGLQELSLDSGTVSLDVLRQEREALDTVFSELSNVPDSTRKSTDAAANDFSDSKAILRSESYEKFLRGNTADLPPVRRDIDQGGMVLLEPSGDANLSAYDLIETVATGFLDTNEARPLRVEVSVGMYQALDIGAYEVQTNLNQGAVSTPSTAARPSAAAENASGKISRQPS